MKQAVTVIKRGNAEMFLKYLAKSKMGVAGDLAPLTLIEATKTEFRSEESANSIFSKKKKRSFAGDISPALRVQIPTPVRIAKK